MIDGEPAMWCANCGANRTVGINAGIYPCPHCGSTVRVSIALSRYAVTVHMPTTMTYPATTMTYPAGWYASSAP